MCIYIYIYIYIYIIEFYLYINAVCVYIQKYVPEMYLRDTKRSLLHLCIPHNRRTFLIDVNPFR